MRAPMNQGLRAAPLAEAVTGESGRTRIGWGLPLVIVALTLLTIRLPQEFRQGVVGDSWNAALVYAHLHGFQFGDNVVFPYGPLGYLSLNHFVPETATPRLLLALLMTTLTVAGLCLLAWRMKPPWRVAWMVLFVILCGALHRAGDDTFRELSVLAWGLLCLLESGRRLKWAIGCLLVAAVLAALIKVSSAVLAFLALGTVICDLILRKRSLLAAAMAGIFCVGWLAAWLLLGQSLANVPIFFQHWLQTASAYNDAMSLDEGSVTIGLLILATAAAACVLRVATMNWEEEGRLKLRKKLLLLWLLTQIFLAWKYGYVRSDQEHLELFLMVLPMIALILEALPVSLAHWQWASRAAALACTALAFCTLFALSHNFVTRSLERSAKSMKDNLRAIFQPAAYVEEKIQLQKAKVAKMQLPMASHVINRATVDVFGQYPILAIFNGWNYHPRPVIQSYAACGEQLMALNERFFLSTNAPEFVLLDLDAVDHRFPAVEDALALRAVLCNYQLVTNDNVYVVLHHVRNGPAKLKLLREGNAMWGARIELTNTAATNLWLELDAQPSLAGRARQFLYKPPEVMMSVWSGTNARPNSFRVPVSMLKAGFIASPVLLSPTDISHLFQGKNLANATGVLLDCGRTGAWPWQPQIHYRLYTTENLLAAQGK